MDLKLSIQRWAVLAATAIVAIDASDQPLNSFCGRMSMSEQGHGQPCDRGSRGLPAAASHAPHNEEYEPYWQGRYRPVAGQHTHAGQVQLVPGASGSPHGPLMPPPGIDVSNVPGPQGLFPIAGTQRGPPPSSPLPHPQPVAGLMANIEMYLLFWE